MRRLLAALVAGGLGWALTACAPASPSGPAAPRVVRVAAASDLEPAMDDVAELVEDRQPGVEVAVTFGSSGTFVQQLANGAPFDVYLSADLGYAEQVVDAGLADRDDLFRYAVGRLAVWVPHGSPVDVSRGLAALSDPAVGAVAIANPRHAPYGRAAVEAMRSAGVHDDVVGALVLGENVAQAAEFVRSGNADVGVLALSLAAGPLRDAGRWSEVPRADFSPLVQGGVVLAAARDRAAAGTVRDALLSDEGRALLRRHGFDVPER